MAMFTTPARSHSTPDREPKTSGTARVKDPAMRPASEMLGVRAPPTTQIRKATTKTTRTRPAASAGAAASFVFRTDGVAGEAQHDHGEHNAADEGGHRDRGQLEEVAAGGNAEAWRRVRAQESEEDERDEWPAAAAWPAASRSRAWRTPPAPVLACFGSLGWGCPGTGDVAVVLMLHLRCGCLRVLPAVAAFLWLGFRPKIDRTSGGAAMNSTMNDWTTSTMSIGMPVWICMRRRRRAARRTARRRRRCPTASSVPAGQR